MEHPPTRPGPNPYGLQLEPTPIDRRQVVLRWIAWFAILTLITIVMISLRPRLDKAHVALGFLIVVLGGSAAGGRILGVSLALLAFFLFNFLFLTPYYTFIIG